MNGSTVMAVYGTRPEAIKMAPLIAELRDDPGLRPIVAVTGQHREMLDQVNRLFDITPEHDLDLMRSGATLPQLTSRMLAATGELFAATKPDAVVVQGARAARSPLPWQRSTSASRWSTWKRVAHG